MQDLLRGLPFPDTPAQAQLWPRLSSGALALALSSVVNEKPILIVTASSAQAESLRASLRFFLPEKQAQRLALFSDYETLPYDVFSPAEDLISERLDVLHRAASGAAPLLITSIKTLLQRLPPVDYVLQRSLSFAVGERVDADAFRSQLVERGYRVAEIVREHGEVAVRGSLIDVFPMGLNHPCRLDLFDDEIESIRLFDPETQLTREKVESIRLLPGREFSMDRQSIQDFRNRWYQTFDADPRKSSIYESVARGFAPQGIESYLPLFFDKTASLFDYLRADTRLVLCDGLTDAAESFWLNLQDRHEQYSGNIERPLLRPHQIYLSVADCFASVNQYSRVRLDANSALTPEVKPLPDVTLHYRAENPFSGLEKLIGATESLLIAAESAGRREVLLDTLAAHGIRPTAFASWQEFLDNPSDIGICIGMFEQGWLSRDDRYALLAENDLFGERIKQKAARSRRADSWTEAERIIRDLTELREGSPVVHIEHGVGRFLGLETLRVNGADQEFLALEYADRNKLYVPVDALELIARHSGADSDSAPLNRLGSDQWEKAKRKAREIIRDTAAELLEIYARRQARQGNSYKADETEYQRFCQEFPFEETEDQLSCIRSVEEDMAAQRPMDRLICGDVGFGKTEIAMRAAFIAVNAGRQVAVLVPTTLLARQHAETFRDRFANWPVQVESISRMRSESEQSKAIEAFSNGKIDILIGTHKLLHQKFAGHNLGLLIVDEEHRFGVRQKEALKALKTEVDILTLTATPIPRTLNMAMASIRDLSIIATPPARRLAIKTFVHQDETRIIQEAIQRELSRGGQVYLVHNEIRSIEKRAQDIRDLIPEARVGIGHGQMREQELERVMGDFYHQRFDVLVCTTIIETGIDIPTANTIIIDRADRFGLAQLHQLRGRVGRSHHQAYAFLLVADRRSITADAVKRLEAIEEADHLGAGFTLATHDLEIRGAGELLGENQSGQIHAIGFDLYQKMLERAVRQLQSGQAIDDEIADTIEVKLGVPTLIPDDYLPDINSRLQLYKRISAASDEDALRAIQVEMIDRFGLLPDPTKTLFALALLKIRARPLGIQRIDIGDASGSISFAETLPFDPYCLIRLVQQSPERYRFAGSTRLQFFGNFDSADKRLAFLHAFLDQIPTESAN